MKKILSAACAILVCFAFAGCQYLLPNSGVPGNTSEEETVKLDSLINGSSSTVDLSEVKISEDAEVRVAKTVKNADFGGKTLTVKVSGVTLENITNCNLVIAEEVGDGEVTVDGCEFENVTVLGGGANSIHIKNTKVVVINVKKDNVRIVLEEKTTVTDALNVHSNSTKIEVTASTASSETEETSVPQIRSLCIGSDVTAITLAGGDFKKVKVETRDGKDVKPVITIASAKTNVETVVVVDSTDNEITEDDVKVNVLIAPEVKEENPDYKVSSGSVKEVTITGIDFDTTAMKTDYTQYDVFNGTGVKATINYSNDTKTEVELEAKAVTLADADKNFSQEAAEEVILHFTVKYLGVSAEKTLTVSVKELEDKVSEAMSLLTTQTPDYDKAVELLKEAYEDHPCNRTRLYYALASIASVSTDESVAEILKENFGFTEYPATMNALFSTEWMQAYNKTYTGCLYKIEQSEDGNYIRCDGTISNGSGMYFSSYETAKVNGEEYGITDTINSTCQFTPSESGKYFISLSNLKDFFGYTDVALSACQKYTINAYTTNYKEVHVLDDITYLPGINVPEWFKETNAYKSNVFGTAYTAGYFSYAITAAVINGNAEGLNNLIDKVTAVFETKFDTAKTLINEMDDDTIEVPEMLVSALNLTQMLGEGTDVYIGKAEADVLAAALEMIQGIFEYIQANDMSFTLGNLKEHFDYVMDTEEESSSSSVSEKSISENLLEHYEFMNTLLTSLNVKDAFGARNEEAMTKSKTSISNALSTVISSYEFLTGENSYYPEQLKQMLSSYGNGICVAVKALTEDLKDGAKFPVPYALISSSSSTGTSEAPFIFTVTSWEFTDSEVMFYIDFNELFKAGAFKGLVATDAAGNYVLDYYISTKKNLYYEDADGNSVNETASISDCDIFDPSKAEEIETAHKAAVEEAVEEIKSKYTENASYRGSGSEMNYGMGVAFTTSVIEKVFPDLLKKNYPEGSFSGDYFMSQMFGFGYGSSSGESVISSVTEKTDNGEEGLSEETDTTEDSESDADYSEETVSE